MTTSNANVPECWQRSEQALAVDDTWRAYWEGIQDRQDVFRIEARDYVARVVAALKPSATTRVLDFGCGFGHTAMELSRHVGVVALWDASSAVRQQAMVRVSGLRNIEFLDLQEGVSPGAVEPFDLILVHSVLQYMSPAEIEGWLHRWRGLLSPNGKLVLSDLITPGAGGLTELADYLKFAARNGFFWNALIAGMKETGRYASARRSRPLTTVTHELLAQWAGAAGLAAQWLPANLSHRKTRATAVLQFVR